MTELDIDSIALEAAQDVAKISRSMPVGGHSQMVAQMQCRIIEAINAAKRTMLGSAEPVATIRFERGTLGKENDMPRVISCNWLPDGEYSVYTAPPAPVSAEPVVVK